MKFDEALKLQNFKEHYSIVLGNISIATRELERLLMENDSIKEVIAGLNRNAFSLRKEIESLTHSLSDARKIIKESKEASEILAKKREDTDKYVKENLSILDIQKNSLEMDIRDLSNMVNELLGDKDVIEKSILALMGQSENLRQGIYSLTKESSKERDSKNQLDDEIEKNKSMNAKDIEKHSKELESIIKLQNEERDKITMANVYIQKKEKDIDVMTRRLKSLYAELLPGKEIKI